MSDKKQTILGCSLVVLLIMSSCFLLAMNADAFLNWVFEDEAEADEIAAKWADMGARMVKIMNVVSERLGLPILFPEG